MKFTEIQLTDSAYGHTLNSTQIFSKDDQWIVYDTRNFDTAIASTCCIEMVNVKTKEIKSLYTTHNQTEYGPGVGAATFSPQQDSVLFIHGIRDANKENPYSITRRTGVAIDIRHPQRPIYMDARDIDKPYTKGALRGGTHAHTWSGDGKWISFTYNDFVMAQRAKTDTSIRDLRTVGIMFPQQVHVNNPDRSLENNSGAMFSTVVARVLENPKWGTDEIDKAFDETWIGKEGYLDTNGKRHKKAIAFQGNIKGQQGKTKTEVFILDLPAAPTEAEDNKPLEGTDSTRPNVPKGVVQRRITYTKNGIEGPRFWLRSTPDGSLIVFLMKDKKGIVQLYGVSPNGGTIRQITANDFPVQGPFNIGPEGKYIAYPADNSIFIVKIKSGESQRITECAPEQLKPEGAPIWSNKGDKLAYMHRVKYKTGYFLQIFLLKKT